MPIYAILVIFSLSVCNCAAKHCGSQLDVGKGTLSPPADYSLVGGPDGIHCFWDLVATEGSKVLVKFTHFEMKSKNCSVENVTMFDLLADEKIGIYCGMEVETTILSTSSQLRITFTSRQFMTSSTFVAVYEPHHCGGVLKERNGTFASPLYPKRYPLNSNCEWTIISPIPGIKLVFQQFDVGASSCTVDSVRIYDGMNSMAPLVDTLCGRFIDRSYRTSGTYLHIVLHANQWIQRATGFKAYYETTVEVANASQMTINNTNMDKAPNVNQIPDQVSMITKDEGYGKILHPDVNSSAVIDFLQNQNQSESLMANGQSNETIEREPTNLRSNMERMLNSLIALINQDRHENLTSISDSTGLKQTTITPDHTAQMDHISEQIINRTEESIPERDIVNTGRAGSDNYGIDWMVPQNVDSDDQELNVAEQPVDEIKCKQLDQQTKPEVESNLTKPEMVVQIIADNTNESNLGIAPGMDIPDELGENLELLDHGAPTQTTTTSPAVQPRNVTQQSSPDEIDAKNAVMMDNDLGGNIAHTEITYSYSTANKSDNNASIKTDLDENKSGNRNQSPTANWMDQAEPRPELNTTAESVGTRNPDRTANETVIHNVQHTIIHGSATAYNQSGIASNGDIQTVFTTISTEVKPDNSTEQLSHNQDEANTESVITVDDGLGVIMGRTETIHPSYTIQVKSNQNYTFTPNLDEDGWANRDQNRSQTRPWVEQTESGQEASTNPESVSELNGATTQNPSAFVDGNANHHSMTDSSTGQYQSTLSFNVDSQAVVKSRDHEMTGLVNTTVDNLENTVTGNQVLDQVKLTTKDNERDDKNIRTTELPYAYSNPNPVSSVGWTELNQAEGQTVSWNEILPVGREYQSKMIQPATENPTPILMDGFPNSKYQSVEENSDWITAKHPTEYDKAMHALYHSSETLSTTNSDVDVMDTSNLDQDQTTITIQSSHTADDSSQNQSTGIMHPEDRTIPLTPSEDWNDRVIEERNRSEISVAMIPNNDTSNSNTSSPSLTVRAQPTVIMDENVGGRDPVTVNPKEYEEAMNALYNSEKALSMVPAIDNNETGIKEAVLINTLDLDKPNAFGSLQNSGSSKPHSGLLLTLIILSFFFSVM